MSGDTGHLQRLTDEQVNARLAAYGDGGAFETALRSLWDQVGEVIAEASRRHFGDDACLGRDHFIKPINEAWVRSVADHGLKMYAGKRNVPEFIAARGQMTSDVVRVLDDRFAGEERIEAIDTLNRVMTYSQDIVLAQIALLEANEAADQRGRQSEQFERRVADLVHASTDQSKALTDRTRATAASARGMLGKTSEVAAAAEQSAVAMREAAQTAAGLIRAIEDARTEVETAAALPFAPGARPRRPSRSARRCRATSKRSNRSLA